MGECNELNWIKRFVSSLNGVPKPIRFVSSRKSIWNGLNICFCSANSAITLNEAFMPKTQRRKDQIIIIKNRKMDCQMSTARIYHVSLSLRARARWLQQQHRIELNLRRRLSRLHDTHQNEQGVCSIRVRSALFVYVVPSYMLRCPSYNCINVKTGIFFVSINGRGTTQIKRWISFYLSISFEWNSMLSNSTPKVWFYFWILCCFCNQFITAAHSTDSTKSFFSFINLNEERP